MRFLLLLFSFTVWATPPQFDQGVEALSQKNYAQATPLFQEVLQQEPNNLTAWHNLALSSLGQKEDLKAYAYWRKALVLDPGFRPAKEGLSYLMKTGKISQIPSSSLLESLGLSQMFMVLFFVTFATGLLLIRFLRAKKQIGKEGKTPPLSVLTLAIIFWVILCSLTGFKAINASSAKALAMDNSVSVKSAPTENGAQLFTLKGGDEAEVLSVEGEWLQVSSGALVGWVQKQSMLVL